MVFPPLVLRFSIVNARAEGTATEEPVNATAAANKATAAKRSCSPIARDQLSSALDSATGGNKDDRIFLRADRSAPYGDVMAVMNELRAAPHLSLKRSRGQ